MKTKRNPCLCCAFDPGTRDLYTIHYTLGRCLSGLCARLCLSRANFVFANRTTCSWHPDHRSYSLFLLSLSGVRVSGLFAPAPPTRDRCLDRGLKLSRFYLSADEWGHQFSDLFWSRFRKKQSQVQKQVLESQDEDRTDLESLNWSALMLDVMSFIFIFVVNNGTRNNGALNIDACSTDFIFEF